MSKHKYYSQGGEDFLIWQILGDRPTGVFVDVGAFDGIHLSNSYSFELAGWRGICVEPIPDIYELCLRNRPRTACVHAACVGDPAIDRVTLKREKLGLLSTVSEDIDEADIRRRYENRGLEFEGFESIDVPARTLDSILDEQLPDGVGIDFVSIDVEGAEVQVLDGFDLNRFRPRIVVVEANSAEAKALNDAIVCGRFGYHEATEVACNVFYTRDADDASRAAQVDVVCQIEPHTHPYGERFTPDRFIQGKQVKSARRARRDVASDNESPGFVNKLKRIFRGKPD